MKVTACDDDEEDDSSHGQDEQGDEDGPAQPSDEERSEGSGLDSLADDMGQDFDDEDVSSVSKSVQHDSRNRTLAAPATPLVRANSGSSVSSRGVTASQNLLALGSTARSPSSSSSVVGAKRPRPPSSSRGSVQKTKRRAKVSKPKAKASVKAKSKSKDSGKKKLAPLRGKCTYDINN